MLLPHELSNTCHDNYYNNNLFIGRHIYNSTLLLNSKHMNTDTLMSRRRSLASIASLSLPRKEMAQTNGLNCR